MAELVYALFDVVYTLYQICDFPKAPFFDKSIRKFFSILCQYYGDVIEIVFFDFIQKFTADLASLICFHRNILRFW